MELKYHPYEIKFNTMVAWAKAHHQARGPQAARPKVIPDHIFTVFDPDENLWGMFNKRLGEWVGTGEERTRFRTAEIAQNWYRSLV